MSHLLFSSNWNLRLRATMTNAYSPPLTCVRPADELAFLR
jgi:hypothetical protein